MKSRIAVIVLGALFMIMAQAGVLYAASASVVSINSLAFDCPATTMTLSLRIDLNANVADYNFGGTNYDLFEVVLYDGAGTPFAYKATLVAQGASGTFNIGYSIFMNLPQYRPFTIRLFDLNTFPTDFTEAQNGPLLDEFTFDPNDYVITPCSDLPLYQAATPIAPAAPAETAFTDGRINNRDAAAPVVIYGHDTESGRGLIVYSPQGALLLVVSPEQIAAAGDCPAENTLIASAGEVALYRLSSCQFQINAPSLDGDKVYTILFTSLYAGTAYTSAES